MILASYLLLTLATRPEPCVLRPTPHRHCICLAHGPRHGCLRWRCRRQYERA